MDEHGPARSRERVRQRATAHARVHRLASELEESHGVTLKLRLAPSFAAEPRSEESELHPNESAFRPVFVEEDAG